jgi:hypothetical protein
MLVLRQCRLFSPWLDQRKLRRGSWNSGRCAWCSIRSGRITGCAQAFSKRLRATQATSPLLFGLLMNYMGTGVIAVLADLGLSACVALLLLKARPATPPTPA